MNGKTMKTTKSAFKGAEKKFDRALSLCVLLTILLVLSLAFLVVFSDFGGKEESVISQGTPEGVPVKIIMTLSGDQNKTDYTVVESEDGIRKRVRGIWGKEGESCEISVEARMLD